MVHTVMARTLVVVEHMLSMTTKVAVPKKLQTVGLVAQMPLGTSSMGWKFLNFVHW